MFDKNKNLRIKSKIEEYEDTIKRLEDLKSKIVSKRDELQDSCSHDLILCYDILDDGHQILKQGRCLTCGNYFELDGTFDMFSERDINKNSIIDITNVLDIDNKMICGRNLIYLRAKDIFQRLISSDEIVSLEVMKIRIINSLILKERDLKLKKLERVKID